MAISIDPATGLKIFNTRAAKATEKISGPGYGVTVSQTGTNGVDGASADPGEDGGNGENGASVTASADSSA